MTWAKEREVLHPLSRVMKEALHSHVRLKRRAHCIDPSVKYDCSTGEEVVGFPIAAPSLVQEQQT